MPARVLPPEKPKTGHIAKDQMLVQKLTEGCTVPKILEITWDSG
jgi:hypothetical protein